MWLLLSAGCRSIAQRAGLKESENKVTDPLGACKAPVQWSKMSTEVKVKYGKGV